MLLGEPGPSTSVLARAIGELVVFAFFDFFAGDTVGEPGRFLLRLNSASSVRLALDFPLLFAGLLLSSDRCPISESMYGESDLPASEEILVFVVAFRTAPLRALGRPIQDARCGA